MRSLREKAGKHKLRLNVHKVQSPVSPFDLTSTECWNSIAGKTRFVRMQQYGELECQQRLGSIRRTM